MQPPINLGNLSRLLSKTNLLSLSSSSITYIKSNVLVFLSYVYNLVIEFIKRLLSKFPGLLCRIFTTGHKTCKNQFRCLGCYFVTLLVLTCWEWQKLYDEPLKILSLWFLLAGTSSDEFKTNHLDCKIIHLLPPPFEKANYVFYHPYSDVFAHS